MGRYEKKKKLFKVDLGIAEVEESCTVLQNKFDIFDKFKLFLFATYCGNFSSNTSLVGKRLYIWNLQGDEDICYTKKTQFLARLYSCG